MSATILVLVCLILAITFMVVLKTDKFPKGIKTLAIISLIYPLSKSCQILIIGPNWFRWWATDFGFDMMFSLVIFFLINTKTKEPRTTLIKSGFISFAICSLIEISQIISVNFLGTEHLIKEGIKVRGDYIDILMYFLGLAIVIIVAFDSSLKPAPVIPPNKYKKMH